MASIRNLKEPNGSVFYPLTHERAVKDSNGVSLESKLAGLESKSYVEAWDGASTPVVANIPAGVTVTYNTTTYTGTLDASASTIGKIYLVKNGSDYDRYITSQSGNTYSWVPNGSTEMDLLGYATDAELGQLRQDFTADISQLGQYVEKPEFVKVVVDNDERVLYGVRKDGDFFFGAGVPSQIRNELRKKANISELNNKVDKIEGKTLIDGDVASSESVIENPEYLKVITDKDGKIICGIKKDGTFYFAKNDEIEEIKREIQSSQSSNESFVKNQEDFNTESRIIPYSIGTTTQAIDYAPGYNRLIIGFMTDNHIDLGNPGVSLENVKNAIEFFNNLKVPISCILEGGDVITQYNASKPTYKEMLKPFFSETWKAKIPFLYTKGNHDINAIGVPPSSVLNEDDWDAVWFGRAENQYGIVRKTKANGKKSGYYYYDIPAFKVRIVSLDCYDLDFSKTDASGNVLYAPGSASYIANEQMNWLASTALNFDNKSDKGWGVLIFLHYSGNPADEYGTTIEPRFRSIYGAFNRMLVAFSNRTTYSEEYTFADNAFYDLSISADWSRYAELESAPYLIGVLSGHRHWDYNYNWNGVQNIFTANQFCGEYYSDDRVKRTAGTHTQNLFDIFSIDLPKRKIRAIRYGAGLNCYGIGGDRFLPDGLSF